MAMTEWYHFDTIVEARGVVASGLDGEELVMRWMPSKCAV
jgi:hypothetical protein